MSCDLGWKQIAQQGGSRLVAVTVAADERRAVTIAVDERRVVMAAEAERRAVVVAQCRVVLEAARRRPIV